MRKIFLKLKSWGLGNILLGLLALYMLATRLPSAWEAYSSQGQQVPLMQVQSLPLMQQMDFPTQSQVVVFWATWCGPCEVELERLQAMIERGELSAGQVLAISSFEDPAMVLDHVQKMGWTFSVAVDVDGVVARSYQVRGTPTLVVFDSDRRVLWRTTGVSPSLELRLKTWF